MVHKMIINLPSDIGSIIRDARKRKGLTQTQLAQMVGIQQRTISVIETDPSNTSLKKIVKICKALGLIINIGQLESTRSSDEVEW